jgi:polysaccharide pyruvyl transferase WcaK-like protein
MARAGLFFGHVASNLGDLALNVGVGNLFAAAGVDEPAVTVLNPNDRYRDRASTTLPTTHGNVKTLRTRERGTELLHSYCEAPEALFVDLGLEEIDTVFLHSGEHLFAPRHTPHADVLWRILPGLAAKATGRRLIVLPSTFGPFEHPRLSDVIGGLLSVADAAACREVGSARIVADRFDDRLPVHLDPAFFLSSTTQMRSRGPGDPVRLGLILRLEDFGLRAGVEASNVTSARLKKSQYLESIAYRFGLGVVERLSKAPVSYLDLFVQTVADRALQAALADASKSPDGMRVRLLKEESIERYQMALSGQDFLVSARFHGCILSFLSRVPACGVHMESHGHKMPGLFETLGVSEYSLSLSRERAHEQGYEVADLYRRRGEAFREVWPRIEAMKDDAVRWLSHALTGSVSDRRTEAGAALTRLAELGEAIGRPTPDATGTRP